MAITYTIDPQAKHLQTITYFGYLPELLEEFKEDFETIELKILIRENYVISGLGKQSKLTEKEEIWSLDIPVNIYHNTKSKLELPEPGEFYNLIKNNVKGALDQINAAPQPEENTNEEPEAT